MPKYEILLVDDDPLLLQDIGPPIEKYGYNVTVADNGESAVGILDKKNFDLVITDLVMSPLDGFQVLKKSKENGSSYQDYHPHSLRGHQIYS